MDAKWGMELVMDIHGCDSNKFDEKNLRSFFQDLCDISEMTAVGEPIFWHCESDMPHLGGTSAIQFIITSSILIHTVDMMNDAYINFFSCKDFDVQKVIEYITKHFSVGHYHYSVIKRGHQRDNIKEEIEIRLINKSERRYDTDGDYFIENDKLIYQVVDDTKDIYTKFTLIHEIIEHTLLNYRKKISIQDVEDFDLAFDKDPERVKLYNEPGNDKSCPYYMEHQFAENITKLMCAALDINYDDYNK